MQEKFEIWQCPVCGNIVEGVHAGGGTLVCCGEPMVQMVENTTDAAQEKHLPVFHKEGNVVKITVGSVPHPMTAEHFIEWIEICTDTRSQRKYLKPGDAPEAEFCCPPCCSAAAASATPRVRAYCNLHGLWESRPNL